MNDVFIGERAVVYTVDRTSASSTFWKWIFDHAAQRDCRRRSGSGYFNSRSKENR